MQYFVTILEQKGNCAVIDLIRTLHEQDLKKVTITQQNTFTRVANNLPFRGFHVTMVTLYEQFFQVIIPMTAMLVSSLHNTVLGITTKCSITVHITGQITTE